MLNVSPVYLAPTHASIVRVMMRISMMIVSLPILVDGAAKLEMSLVTSDKLEARLKELGDVGKANSDCLVTISLQPRRLSADPDKVIRRGQYDFGQARYCINLEQYAGKGPRSGLDPSFTRARDGDVVLTCPDPRARMIAATYRFPLSSVKDWDIDEGSEVGYKTVRISQLRLPMSPFKHVCAFLRKVRNTVWNNWDK